MEAEYLLPNELKCVSACVVSSSQSVNIFVILVYERAEWPHLWRDPLGK